MLRLTEADSGSDRARCDSGHAATARTGTARRQDVDHQRLHRDVAVVWARTPDGIRGFLVEKGTPGFTAQDVHHKLPCAHR